MAVVIIEEAITVEQLQFSREEYDEYVKVVVDIEREILAAGGEWHADAERVLLAAGSRQEHLWGGGVNLTKNKIEFNSLINMRPGVSASQEVIDQAIRDKMEEIIRRIFKL
ncbi:hypothetical protein A3A84_03740 [Candidatus Collierbacteria bacterium RIFCSPLOWO2_01_FULL_50_23]|uniref:Uncharacterized protein n=2 Tax=Candidatus Collieribacteriota TaxID=1752725 RepID=A0A1F5ESQ5_9BACT|nr:MAG: hypothetical protein A3D09_01490 [Candidatus Collierbacteria bacterium RIFCSPHIGHO2_02_FULL_49_10]OGD71301.1 MAG: hypothetical protein A2703_03320 [Candidatus Collierbacteria bacterium RIFCSPHIGHO2_01_FULL_50_25]OGD75282.1 MAG: hypothetical protein A3A84_03740 [Candidatus Collierbacteria bacterium RIFCSPLOWO2_01_FULL_50_23]